MQSRIEAKRLVWFVGVLTAGAWLAGEVGPAAAGEPTPSSTDTAPAPMSKWETRVHAALRRESAAKGADQNQAVRELVSLYDALEKTKGIDKEERADLRRLIRNRLTHSSERISKRLGKASKKPATSEAPAPAAAPVAPSRRLAPSADKEGSKARKTMGWSWSN